MTAGRSRGRWSARAASLAISICWHGLLLAVLALAVHPLPSPREARPITVELFPPLPPPPEPPVLRRLAEDQPLPKPVPPQPALSKPIEVKQPTPPVLRRLTEVPQPQPPQPLPPEPLQVARPPQPVLAKPTEIQRRPSPAPPRLLETSRAPALPQPVEAEPPKAVSPPQSAAPLAVLTNDRAVQAPVEIRPPDRTAIAPRTTVVAVPQLPTADASGGGGRPGASPSPGSGPGGAGKPFDGHIVGFESDGLRGGLRMRLGCENPDAYRLSPTEKAECLRRLADQAMTAKALGPNIPEAKQAQYDRQSACHRTTETSAIPGSSSESPTTGKVLGLGDNARLRDCGPGDR